MKKKIETFLRFLEDETTIDIHYQTFSAPEKFTDSNGKKCRTNLIIIGNRPCLLKITSSSTRGEKKILGLEILYMDDSGLFEAEYIQKKMKLVIPSIPVTHNYLFDAMPVLPS